MAAPIAFNPQRFFVQWLLCLALVLLTYNPFGDSYYHWVMRSPEDLFFKAVVGLALLFTYVFLLWVIFSSVGRRGIVIGIVLWVLMAYQVFEWIPTDSLMLRRLVQLACLATLLAVGLIWPHMLTRLTGQIQKRYLIKKRKKKKLLLLPQQPLPQQQPQPPLLP